MSDKMYNGSILHSDYSLNGSCFSLLSFCSETSNVMVPKQVTEIIGLSSDFDCSKEGSWLNFF